MRGSKRNQKQVRIVIGLSICLLLIMTVGYAAFSTNITLSARGNIKSVNAAIQLKKNIVTSGDGLYKDVYQNDRYVYKGLTPKNYIKLNNELWRIISIENDETLKIIKDEGVGNRVFDSRTGLDSGPRYNSDNTYCQGDTTTTPNYQGCNAWQKVSGNFVNGKFSGTVTQDAELNIYLNDIYYTSLDDNFKKYIQSHAFNGGAVKYKGNIAEVLDDEKQYKPIGNIGLANASDWFMATTNAECDVANNGWYDWPDGSTDQNYYKCSLNNYLYKSYKWWFLTPRMDTNAYLFISNSFGAVDNYHAYYDVNNVRPVVYLKSDIKLSGEGTKSDPYILE